MLNKLHPLLPSILKGGWVRLLEEFSCHLGAKEKKKTCCGSVNWAQCFANTATPLLDQGWPVRPSGGERAAACTPLCAQPSGS